MPIAACNLILVTAAEGNDLVGDSFFGHVLPLAARGAWRARTKGIQMDNKSLMSISAVSWAEQIWQ